MGLELDCIGLVGVCGIRGVCGHEAIFGREERTGVGANDIDVYIVFGFAGFGEDIIFNFGYSYFSYH